MDYAVLSGDLDLPGYFSPGGQRRYQRCFWMPPGIESVDVLRDIKGVVTAADRGMYDPQDWIMSQGEDPEEVLSGIKEFQDLVKQFGIELSGQKEDTNIQEKTNEDD
jgi:capsid protein